MGTYRTYKITNTLNNKIYFGYTSRSISHRWKKHCCSKHDCYIARSIRKHGVDNFIIEQLHEFDSSAEAKTTEIYLIAKFQTNVCRYPAGNGMNLTDGGEGAHGFKHTKEAIDKMKDIQGNRSDEWKRRISLGHRGKVLSDTHKKAISDSSIGRHWTNESRMKVMGEMNHFFGKKHSQETKDKIRQSKKHKMRAVQQLTPEGELIQEFTSLKEAMLVTGVDRRDIISVCKGRGKTAKGFKWRYIDG